LQVVQNYPLAKKSTGFFTKIAKKRVIKEKYASVATTLEAFCMQFHIPLDADEDESFAQRWNAAYFMCMGIENIAEALLTEDVLEWMFTTFHTPAPIAAAIRQHRALLQIGGVADHCLLLSYHWLITTRFLEDTRMAQEVEIVDIQQKLGQQALRALKPHDSEKRRLGFVNEELGLQSDIEHYLKTHLVFSFNAERLMDDTRLTTYENARTRNHKRTCIICNRDIPVKMKSNAIMTDIASQQAQIFSNKLQPSLTVKAQMVWCPMCYLEFMLRKLGGQSYPTGSDYTASYRLHLYVLPDYSFTPQLWEYTSQQLLKNVHAKETVVSKLVLRGSKDDPALPTRWLNQHNVDEEWLEQVRDMFAAQAIQMKTQTKEGKSRGKQGDRITFSIKNPNYMLITYDTVVAKSAEKGLAPTHIEVWTKALYAATLIHLLTGARVYVTDKPYLSILRPEQMKTIIEMEGLHPLLSGILPLSRDADADTDLLAGNNSRRLPLSTLPAMLDVLAAIWEINAGLTQNTSGPRRNLDKQVAHILEEVKINYLAGATLYKTRERDKASPYPAFTRACQILLPQYKDHLDEFRMTMQSEGYELMFDTEGGYLMSLADRITTTSLQLYHPRMGAKGRAHRFETLFRTGVDAMKNNASSSENDEELISRVAGTVLKRLERIIDGGGFAPTYNSAQRLKVINTFATLLVNDLFRQVCGGSVSKLTHEENHLADAIYFLTFQKVQRYWEERKKQSPTELEKTETHEELTTSDR
jgi:CRISPR type I-D-associated protein Csc3/Cas10d